MTVHDRDTSQSSSITGYQWLVLVIASAGWVFDVYEGQLFTIFKTPALKELLGVAAKGNAIDRHAGLAMALFLVGGAVGGVSFGILGDRFGRVRMLSWTILTYSLFSALTSFAHSVWELHMLRFLVALGVGGEWAIAAALVAETFPSRARALASGTFHASSVVGSALASLSGMLLVGPGAWRWGFLLGLAPSLLVLGVRMSLREPESWRRSATTGESGRISELLSDPRWRPRAWLGFAMAAIGLGTYWGIFAWGPELAHEVLGPSVPEATRRESASFAYLLMNMTGGLLGLLAFAPLASWCGRRFAFAVYHVAALILVPVTFLGASTYSQVLWLLPAMAFFVVGLHAGYAVYFPELFPTRLRATGSSFCFNGGRLLGGIALLVRGELGAHLGLRWAAVAMASLFLVGLVLVWFAPETRGQDLPE